MARRLAATLAIAVFAALFASTAAAAAPRYIMITGKGIAKPILLADWRENMALETALVLAPKATQPSGLSVRSRLTLWLFWGWDERRPQWPGQANQRGWLYPATNSRPALIALRVDGRSALRVVTARLLRILERHAVPTR
jgi:hypothetical protein